MLNESWAAIGVTLVLLIAVVKYLVPKMMDAENVGKRFGIGVTLFLIYTAVTLLVFYYFCTFEGTGFGSGEAVFVRIVVAFLIVNLMTLFGACLYFFTREKRRLTQAEKMKLKDL